MIVPDDNNLLPEVKMVDTYIGTIEHLIYSVQVNCNLTIFPPSFFTQLLKVSEEVRILRNEYVNSLKFQNYE